MSHESDISDVIAKLEKVPMDSWVRSGSNDDSNFYSAQVKDSDTTNIQYEIRRVFESKERLFGGYKITNGGLVTITGTFKGQNLFAVIPSDPKYISDRLFTWYKKVDEYVIKKEAARLEKIEKDRADAARTFLKS